MSDKKLKSISKMQESRLKTMKQKEENIGTLLTTTKNNPTFAKLLIFTLNTLENYISPPNREIRVNASVIIRLEGVGILHTTVIKNISKIGGFDNAIGSILYQYCPLKIQDSSLKIL